MEYTVLTSDDRYRMLQERIMALEASHYNAYLNFKSAQSSGLRDDMAKYEGEMGAFELVIEPLHTEISLLPVPDQPIAPVRTQMQRPQPPKRPDR